MAYRKKLDPAIPQIHNDEIAYEKENDINTTSFLSDAEILDISKSAVSNYYCVFERIPNLIYFMQNFTFPGVSAKVIDIARPQHADKLPVFAHSLTFDDLSLNFIMDENFLTYFKMMQWMFEAQYEWLNEPTYTRMMLIILNNAKLPIIKVDFSNVIINSISSIDFQIQNADTITWNCSLKYYSYRVKYMDGRLEIPWEYPDSMFPNKDIKYRKNVIPSHPMFRIGDKVNQLL